MNKSATKILQKHTGFDNIDSITIDYLKKSCSDNPYFPIFQLFLAEKLKRNTGTDGLEQLQKTALYFPNELWLKSQLIAPPAEIVEQLPTAIISPSNDSNNPVDINPALTNYSSEDELEAAAVLAYKVLALKENDVEEKAPVTEIELVAFDSQDKDLPVSINENENEFESANEEVEEISTQSIDESTPDINTRPDTEAEPLIINEVPDEAIIVGDIQPSFEEEVVINEPVSNEIENEPVSANEEVDGISTQIIVESTADFNTHPDIEAKHWIINEVTDIALVGEDIRPSIDEELVMYEPVSNEIEFESENTNEEVDCISTQIIEESAADINTPPDIEAEHSIINEVSDEAIIAEDIQPSLEEESALTIADPLNIVEAEVSEEVSDLKISQGEIISEQEEKLHEEAVLNSVADKVIAENDLIVLTQGEAETSFDSLERDLAPSQENPEEPDEHERMFRNIKAMLDSTVEEAKANAHGDGIDIDPYHTIDYFASQGIKLDFDQNPNDQLGKNLKKFTHWLKHMKKLGPEDIIESSPGSETESEIQQIADSSNKIKEVVTEAMAQVLEIQGKKAKAIELYNKLSFLYPLKSTYFADRIKKLKGN